MPSEQPDYVVLKYKDPSVQHYAARVPDGATVDEVIEAYKPLGWSRGAQKELPELLNEAALDDPNPPVPPVTPKEK